MVLNLFAKNVCDILKKALFPLFQYLQVHANNIFIQFGASICPLKPIHILRIEESCSSRPVQPPSVTTEIRIDYYMSRVLSPDSQSKIRSQTPWSDSIYRRFYCQAIYRLILSLKKRRGVLARQHH